MGKPTDCIGENKGADQLRSNCEADQRLCFRYTYEYTRIVHFLLTFCCDCTARFVSDLVGNPEDRFSCAAAHLEVQMYSMTSLLNNQG